MFDLADLLNRRMRRNKVWRKLSESMEDTINAIVGAATDEAINAIGSPRRYMRGDVVDPRSFPDITALDTGGKSYAELLRDRDRSGNVRVVLPIDSEGAAQIYLDIDGATYVATDRQYQSRNVLIQEAKNLGFDFFSDDLSDADYARMVNFVSQYWPRSGSAGALANFLGFIRDIRIDMVQLWTADDGEVGYDILDRFDSSMTPVWKGGKHYPSFHYDLYYDAFADTDVNELERLFYALAPIHLVLRRMVETVRSVGTAYVSTAPSLLHNANMVWQPQKASQFWYKKTQFVSSNINMPLMLVSPNLDLKGVAIAAMGPSGVWVLPSDPAIGNPSDPKQYMLDNGFYVTASQDPKDRFEFPVYGIPSEGLWFMSEVAGVAVIIEAT